MLKKKTRNITRSISHIDYEQHGREAMAAHEQKNETINIHYALLIVLEFKEYKAEHQAYNLFVSIALKLQHWIMITVWKIENKINDIYIENSLKFV